MSKLTNGVLIAQVVGHIYSPALLIRPVVARFPPRPHAPPPRPLTSRLLVVSFCLLIAIVQCPAIVTVTVTVTVTVFCFRSSLLYIVSSPFPPFRVLCFVILLYCYRGLHPLYCFLFPFPFPLPDCFLLIRFPPPPFSFAFSVTSRIQPLSIYHHTPTSHRRPPRRATSTITFHLPLSSEPTQTQNGQNSPPGFITADNQPTRTCPGKC